MIAICDYPGTQRHAARHFSSRTEARAWLAEQRARAAVHPAGGPLPTRIISDRASQMERWLDGSRIYWTRDYPGAALRCLVG